MRSAPPLGTLPPGDPPIVGEVPRSLLDAIRADASARLDVESTDLAVVRAEAVTWNDGSLGCPEPGGVYTMALVDGYHVILKAGERELDYRATESGAFRLCERGRPAE